MNQSPLLTIQEYKDAPTAIDVSNLVINADGTEGTSAAQDAELARVIDRASSWIYDMCQQVIVATQDTEVKRVHPDRWGRISVLLDRFPVRSVSAMKWRQTPKDDWHTVDTSLIDINGRQVTAFDNIPGRVFGGRPYRVEVTYVNGYASTVLTSAASAGDSSIDVKSADGIEAGDTLHIYDGADKEDVTVKSVSGTTITLKNGLIYAHASGIAVSDMPAVIREACILVASWMINQRGEDSFTMETATHRQYLSAKDPRNREIVAANNMLQKYKVVYKA